MPTSPRQIQLQFQHPPETWDKFLGVKLGEDSYDQLLEEDADVFTPEGKLLLRFRRNVLGATAAKNAFDVLRKINQKTLNRGTATGNAAKIPYVRKDGVVSKTSQVPHDFEVISNIIGFYDRYVRTPFCRQTAFNANEPEKFAKVLPFLQSVSRAYEAIDRERWAIQREICDATKPDWIIPGTVFTTITVNKNWQTAVHTDQGDFKGGLSAITALRAGEYRGGNLVFPHYRVAVNLQNLDLLLFDSHHLHGNTPILGKLNGFERVSLVLYYRENMKRCLSPADELKRAQNRKPGDALWE